MTRLLFRDRYVTEHAQYVLDRHHIDYDFDSGNRIMIDDDNYEEAAALLDNSGIRFDEV